MTVRSTIATLAQDFATRVLAEVGRASISDLAQLSVDAPRTPSAPARQRRRGGRSSASGPTIDAIVGALKKGGASGMRSEHLQSALRVTKAQLQQPIRDALASNRIRKTGQRRGTTYFAR